MQRTYGWVSSQLALYRFMVVPYCALYLCVGTHLNLKFTCMLKAHSLGSMPVFWELLILQNTCVFDIAKLAAELYVATL